MTLADRMRLTAQRLAAFAGRRDHMTQEEMRELAHWIHEAANEAEWMEAARQMVPAILPENVVAFRPRSLRAALARLEA